MYFPIFLLALGFLCFLAGAFVVLHRAFPSAYLTDAYRGGMALLEKETQYLDPIGTDLWEQARTEATGIVRHDPGRAFDGYTLYGSGHGPRAFLVSMAGDVVHEWHLPYSAIWDEGAAVQDPQPDAYTYWEKTHLYPNGDLLAIYVAAGDSPWGYGLVKVNKDSELLWKYMAHVHHDLDVAEDGRIYALTHEIRSNVIPRFEYLQPPRIDDFVVVLSPDGEELKKVSVLDALVRSPYARLLNRVAWYTKGDFIHTNAIDVIGREAAAELPFAAEGQVLLSLRELDALMVLDLDKEEIVWAARGPWLAQHDPDILPNGNLLLFDNLGHFGEGGRSRVIEFDPTTLEIAWQYAGNADHFFESEVRSDQQRLPNGNTLITESDGARILEVIPGGDVVWEFVNPVRAGDDGERVPIVARAQRIDPASLDPAFAQAIRPTTDTTEGKRQP